MTSTTIDHSVRTAIEHLMQADQFNRLAKRARWQDRRPFYARKDRAIDRAICETPDDFEVDSISHGLEPILGVTHTPTGRQFHVRPYRQAYAAQVILHRLAEASGYRYAFLRYADVHGRAVSSRATGGAA